MLKSEKLNEQILENIVEIINRRSSSYGFCLFLEYLKKLSSSGEKIDKTNKFYAEKIGVTKMTIYRYIDDALFFKFIKKIKRRKNSWVFELNPVLLSQGISDALYNKFRLFKI